MGLGGFGMLNPEKPASLHTPLARHQKFRSSLPDEICDHMGRVFSPHDLFIAGDVSRLSFIHNQVNLDRISFNFIDYGDRDDHVWVRCPAIRRYVLVQFSLDGGCQFTQDSALIDVPPEHFVVVHPDRPFSVKLMPGYKHLTVRVDREALDLALSRELGQSLKETVEFTRLPIATSGIGHSFATLVEAYCADFDHHDAALNHPRLSWRTEDMLISVMLETLPHNYADALRRPRQEPIPFYVRRAEEFIRAHASEPITFDDVVKAAGASARSLHAGFRKYRGTTPMRLLKKHRLELARRQLLCSQHSGENVTNIALNCGFLHFSRFAADYKASFGESPSQTRRGG
jgi:AraC-like DNA-binding protein